MDNQILKFLPLTLENSIFENLENPQIFFVKFANFLSLFYNVYKDNMFTIEKEDGREAHLKPSIYKF